MAQKLRTLLPSDSMRAACGVVMMRRLITENIDALQNGEGFKTIEQADKIDGIVATYTRDSVMTIAQRDSDETEFRQTLGREIAALVFAAAKKPLKLADDFFARELKRLLERYR